MASTKQERSIRLVGRKTLELDRTSGSSGEIFYDTDTQTLRIYASSSSSVVVATRAWVTSQNYITSTGIPTQTGNSGKYLTTNGTAVSWGTITATAASVGLGNVTNESKATMFASPTFTGTVAGVTATHVGLGNVTNESKATMFASPTFTGTTTMNTALGGLLKATAGVVSAATAGTDYQAPLPSQTGNTGKYLSTNGSALSWETVSGGGSGTVTSVAMSVPSFLSVSGSPITTSGTFALGLSQSPTNGQLLIGTGGSGFNFANLTAGANVTITNSSGGITIASSGGSAGITWFSNTTSGGNITVTNPTGYSTSGSTLVIVVVGLSVSSTSASSGSASFTTGMSVASQMRVLYTPTGVSPGASTTISGIGGGYAMAYAYISGGAGLGTSSTNSSSTSATLSAPASYTGSPRIFATSSSGSLNLATVASTASGGGPTWAAPSGFAHPLDANLTAAAWVGTGSWTTSATPTLTSNSFTFWYVTGVTSFS
jgi:hypothetical protein